MASDSVRSFQDILNGQITRSEAVVLLESAGGCLDTAIAIYFSDPNRSATAQRGESSRAHAKRNQLKEVFGRSLLTDEGFDNLLQRAEGSVEQAVEIFLTSSSLQQELRRLFPYTNQALEIDALSSSSSSDDDGLDQPESSTLPSSSAAEALLDLAGPSTSALPYVLPISRTDLGRRAWRRLNCMRPQRTQANPGPQNVVVPHEVASLERQTPQAARLSYMRTLKSVLDKAVFDPTFLANKKVSQGAIPIDLLHQLPLQQYRTASGQLSLDSERIHDVPAKVEAQEELSTPLLLGSLVLDATVYDPHGLASETDVQFAFYHKASATAKYVAIQRKSTPADQHHTGFLCMWHQQSVHCDDCQRRLGTPIFLVMLSSTAACPETLPSSSPLPALACIGTTHTTHHAVQLRYLMYCLLVLCKEGWVQLRYKKDGGDAAEGKETTKTAGKKQPAKKRRRSPPEEEEGMRGQGKRRKRAKGQATEDSSGEQEQANGKAKRKRAGKAKGKGEEDKGTLVGMAKRKGEEDKDTLAGMAKSKGKAAKGTLSDKATRSNKPNTDGGSAGASTSGEAAAVPGGPTNTPCELEVYITNKVHMWSAAAKPVAKNKVTTALSTCLAYVVHWLLEHGRGLYIGSDADGLLNFGDSPQHEMTCTSVASSAFSVSAVLSSAVLPPHAQPAKPPPQTKTTPKLFQLQGLQWMLDREQRGDALGRGHLHLHPSWLQLVTAQGIPLYWHRYSPYTLSTTFYTAPSGGTCGGLLCDEMGLGKTLQALMLILANPPPPGWAYEGDGVDHEFDPDHGLPIKSTLMVAPANLIGQWQQEIKRHLQPGAITWATYDTSLKGGAAGSECEVFGEGDQVANSNGTTGAGEGGSTAANQRRSSRRKNNNNEGDVAVPSSTSEDSLRHISCITPTGDARPMHSCHLVLMSYEQLRKEVESGSGTKRSPLFLYGFWRIILDEAQLVANTSSVAAITASALWRRHAWLLTGTPLSHSLSELQGLLEFLNYQPFHNADCWRHLMMHHYTQRTAGGLAIFHAMLRGVMLRRTKADVDDELGLPVCAHEDMWVDLSLVEREVYDRRKRGLITALEKYSFEMQHKRDNPARSRHSVSRLMSLLTTLRQTCCHPQIAADHVTQLGPQRLGMRTIMAKLLLKAFTEYDTAVRDLMELQIKLKAAQVMEGEATVSELHSLVDTIASHTAISSMLCVRSAAALRDAAAIIITQHNNTTSCAGARQAGAGEGSGQEGPGCRPMSDGGGGAGCHDAHTTGQAGNASCSSSAIGAPQGMPLENEEEQMARAAEATRRRRFWQKSQLDSLLLLSYVMTGCYTSGAQHNKRKGKGKGKGKDSSNCTGEEWESTLEEVKDATVQLQCELSVEDEGDLVEVRRSRRARGLGADEEADVVIEQNRCAAVKAFELLISKSDPLKSADKAVKAKASEVSQRWHHLQHLLTKDSTLAEAADTGAATTDKENGQVVDKGKGVAQEPHMNGTGEGGDDDEEECCPICLDVPQRRSMTSCGHSFCSDCIHDLVSGHYGKCPICRTSLKESDLFDAVDEEELEARRREANSMTSEFGAKVCTLLNLLSAARESDPTAKAVVFSCWGRLLRLVGCALQANNVQYASLCGANPKKRADELQRFLEDPECSVLTCILSTGGGAAGLTLVNASLAVLMEPSLNPALEAQAGGRIYRLGQTKPTHVVRLLARDTVEEQLLKLQAQKLGAGGRDEDDKESGDGGVAGVTEMDEGFLLALVNTL